MRRLLHFIIGVIIACLEVASCINKAKPRESPIDYNLTKPLVEQKIFHEFDSAGINLVREICASIDSDRVCEYNFFTTYDEWHADSDFKYTSTMEFMIRCATLDLLTLREAKEDCYLIVRGAEKDTYMVVNHWEYRFTTAN